MVGCEDCIHYEVCDYRDPQRYETEKDIKADCRHFMSESDVAPMSENKGLPCVAYNKKHERYQVIHKGKDGRIFASKFYYTRKDAELALAELKKKYTEVR